MKMIGLKKKRNNMGYFAAALVFIEFGAFILTTILLLPVLAIAELHEMWGKRLGPFSGEAD